MKNLEKTSENTIVAFHVGRGGRYYNSGHLTFLGEREIGYFTNDLYLHYENEAIFKNRFGYDYTYNSGQRCISDLIDDKCFDELEEIFGITENMLGIEEYYTGCGHPVGLTRDDVISGIGKINIDYDYDTTYTCYLQDCSDEEISCIAVSDYYGKKDLLIMLEVPEISVDKRLCSVYETTDGILQVEDYNLGIVFECDSCEDFCINDLEAFFELWDGTLHFVDGKYQIEL